MSANPYLAEGVTGASANYLTTMRGRKEKEAATARDTAQQDWQNRFSERQQQFYEDRERTNATESEKQNARIIYTNGQTILRDEKAFRQLIRAGMYDGWRADMATAAKTLGLPFNMPETPPAESTEELRANLLSGIKDASGLEAPARQAVAGSFSTDPKYQAMFPPKPAVTESAIKVLPTAPVSDDSKTQYGNVPMSAIEGIISRLPGILAGVTGNAPMAMINPMIAAAQQRRNAEVQTPVISGQTTEISPAQTSEQQIGTMFGGKQSDAIRAQELQRKADADKQRIEAAFRRETRQDIKTKLNSLWQLTDAWQNNGYGLPPAQDAAMQALWNDPDLQYALGQSSAMPPGTGTSVIVTPKAGISQTPTPGSATPPGGVAPATPFRLPSAGFTPSSGGYVTPKERQRRNEKAPVEARAAEDQRMQSEDQRAQRATEREKQTAQLIKERTSGTPLAVLLESAKSSGLSAEQVGRIRATKPTTGVREPRTLADFMAKGGELGKKASTMVSYGINSFVPYIHAVRVFGRWEDQGWLKDNANKQDEIAESVKKLNAQYKRGAVAKPTAKEVPGMREIVLAMAKDKSKYQGGKEAAAALRRYKASNAEVTYYMNKYFWGKYGRPKAGSR